VPYRASRARFERNAEDVMYSAGRFLDRRRDAITLPTGGPAEQIATADSGKFGRTSVTYIEVFEGLKVCDQVTALGHDLVRRAGHDRVEIGDFDSETEEPDPDGKG